jgi:hypothetical protein
MNQQGARKLTGENLKVIWAEFSTLTLIVSQNVYNLWPIQTPPSLDLKTRTRLCPVSLSLSMDKLKLTGRNMAKFSTLYEVMFVFAIQLHSLIKTAYLKVENLDQIYFSLSPVSF